MDKVPGEVLKGEAKPPAVPVAQLRELPLEREEMMAQMRGWSESLKS